MTQSTFDFAKPKPGNDSLPIPNDYAGILLIGDPHIEARTPGFRSDDYARTVLGKLRWCLETASQQNLLPVFLGDLFQLPRDNPNWLIVELLDLFNSNNIPTIVGIYGNHDVHENQIDENDSLSILAEAGRIRLLDEDHPAHIKISGRDVLIGGTSWGQPFPDAEKIIELKKSVAVVDKAKNENRIPFVVWISHHDLCIPGYEAGTVKLNENLGVDVVVNGHIHRRLPEHVLGATTWINPGNITRRKRSDATKTHVPTVLKITVEQDDWDYSFETVPHQSFEDVFYDAIVEAESDSKSSDFVAGLAELKARRTQTGAGLAQFLDLNLPQFDEDIATEIRSLAKEVLENKETKHEYTA